MVEGNSPCIRISLICQRGRLCQPQKRSRHSSLESQSCLADNSRHRPAMNQCLSCRQARSLPFLRVDKVDFAGVEDSFVERSLNGFKLPGCKNLRTVDKLLLALLVEFRRVGQPEDRCVGIGQLAFTNLAPEVRGNCRPQEECATVCPRCAGSSQRASAKGKSDHQTCEQLQDQTPGG